MLEDLVAKKAPDPWPRRRALAEPSQGPDRSQPSHAPRLPHHAALLRERRAAPRPHVHDRRRRHAGALASRPRRRRRCWSPAPTSTATRSRRRRPPPASTPKAHADRVSQLFRDTWDACGIRYDHFIRTTDDYHVRTVQEFLRRIEARRRHLLRQLRRPLLLRLRALLHREGAGRRQVPRPPGRADVDRRGELLLPHEPLPGAADRRPRGATRSAFAPTAIATKCSPCCAAKPLGDLCISRPKARLELGHRAAVRRPLRHLRLVRRADQLRQRHRAHPARPSATYWPHAEHLIGKDILKPHGVFWPTMLMSAGLPLFKAPARARLLELRRRARCRRASATSSARSR